MLESELMLPPGAKYVYLIRIALGNAGPIDPTDLH